MSQWTAATSNLGSVLVQRPVKLMEDLTRPVLCCPGCSESSVHILEVDVEWRDEDGPVTVSTLSTWEGPLQTETRDSDQGHSPRRNAVVLHVWCEGCWHVHTLAFIQHKGMTYIEAVDLGERDPSEGQA